MLTIISFIVILAILVLVHELGHFLAAKKSGVLVEEFGIGLPPRVWGKKFGETLYSINLLPIGGFVKVHGEEYYEGEGDKSRFKKDRAFVYKSNWQKAFILTAGIIGNFLLGWVLISFLFTQGVLTTTDKVIVEKVQQNSPAQQMGIKPKDQLVEVIAPDKSVELKSTNDLITVTKKYADKPIQLKIKSNGEEKTINITPRKNPPKGQGSLGVVVTSLIEKKYPWYQAPFYGLLEAFNITKHIVTELLGTIFTLLTFNKPQVDVAGPVGIANYTGKAINYGFKAVLELIALLSLNLAVVNILPFPALDGGRLAFVIYEAVTRKRVNQTVERNLNVAGMIILLSLAALITVYDIIKIYN